MGRLIVGTLLASLLACSSTRLGEPTPKTELSGPTVATTTAEADLHSVDEAVITAVIREVILKDPRVARAGVALIEDQSIGNVLLRDYPPALNDDTARLYAAVLARNGSRVRVSCSACPADAILVDASQLAERARTGDRQHCLDGIRKGSYGTYSFHLPGYDGDRALVQYVWAAGELAMEGVWVLAKRSANGWHVVEAKRTWAA